MMKSLILTIATVIPAVTAWWDNAHLLTARIAYDILQTEAPQALAGANEVLAVLKATSDIPALTKEKNYPFVECAPFADTIKGQGYSFQSTWHYVNNPYLDESQDISKYDFNDFTAQNVSSVVADIIEWLDYTPGYQKTATYITTMKYFDNESEGASFALRLLIHYFGDAHQPCHSITLVDSEFPQGDRGCNSLYLPSVDGASNLHAVWDSNIYNQTSKVGLPMSDSTWSHMTSLSKEYRSQYTLASADYHTNDAYAWADENIAIAETVYGGVEENKYLSDAYIAAATKVARQHIYNGGRRLANTIKYLYGTKTAEELFLQ